jgi:hypothetical protein
MRNKDGVNRAAEVGHKLLNRLEAIRELDGTDLTTSQYLNHIFQNQVYIMEALAQVMIKQSNE